MNTSDISLEALARERLAIMAQVEELEDRKKQIDATMMTMLDPGQVVEIDGAPVWRLQRGNRTFNEAKARGILTAEMVAAITVAETKVSSKQAKQVLPPALYDACTVEGNPSIRGVTS